jgi:hypothetical protein
VSQVTVAVPVVEAVTEVFIYVQLTESDEDVKRYRAIRFVRLLEESLELPVKILQLLENNINCNTINRWSKYFLI